MGSSLQQQIKTELAEAKHWLDCYYLHIDMDRPPKNRVAGEHLVRAMELMLQLLEPEKDEESGDETGTS